MYTLIGTPWELRTTHAFLQECLPEQPTLRNNLVGVSGFRVEMMTLALHVLVDVENHHG